MRYLSLLTRFFVTVVILSLLTALLFLTVYAGEISGNNLENLHPEASRLGLLATPGITFTVNTTDDTDDGTCDASHCSLREALHAANALTDTDTIYFDISGAGPHTIQPLAALPVITAPVVIDGVSEPDFNGSPLVELDGSQAGPGVDGLQLTGGDSLVRGLVINRFGGNGIVLSGNGGNLIQGNYIGTDITGTLALGNIGAGIAISGAISNTIGGISVDLGNRIAFNGGAGVVVHSGAGHAVRNNAMGGNDSLGIDLGNDGLTANDGLDADTGPNDYQNFPVLTSALGGNQATIAGTLTSTPNTLFSLDFYANTSCDASTHGEGEIPLGSLDVTIDAGGNVAFTANLSATVLSGQFVTATATDSTNNTSEFSACLAVENATFMVNTTDDSNGFCSTFHCSLREAIQVANAGFGTDLIAFDIPGPGPYLIVPVERLPDITRPVTIDGTTQPGFVGSPIIELSGEVTSEGPGGLYITGGNTTIRGLFLKDFGHHGIEISDKGDNIIQGNIIQNSLDAGIFIWGTSNNVIGGPTVGLGNTIVLNDDAGVGIVRTFEMTGTGNLIQGNVISGTAGSGIDLGTTFFLDGLTPNDIGDSDVGTNNLQNFPILASFTNSAVTTTIVGTLNSSPNTLFTIDFYANSDCSFPFYGEGERFLGSTTTTTDSSGNAIFTATLLTVVPDDQFITATATDPNNNTSEFSRCQPIPDHVPPYFPDNPLISPEPDETITDQQPPITLIWTGAIDEDDIGEDGKVGEYEGWITLVQGSEPQILTASSQPIITFTTAQTSYTLSEVLPNGVYTWTLIARDVAGNTSAPVTPQRFIIDVPEPMPDRFYFLPLVRKN